MPASTDYLANKLSISKLPSFAVWGWMSKGWASLKNSLGPSITIGILVVALTWIIVLSLYFVGFSTMIPAAYGGFILIGPIIATFVYSLSKQLETNSSVHGFKKIDSAPNARSQLGFIGFSLLFMVIVWAILAHLIWSLSVGMGRTMDEAEFLRFVFSSARGLVMISLGSLVGAVLATVCFSISAISLPLVFDRDIDALSAMAFSVGAVIKNPVSFLCWAVVICAIVGLSALFAFLPIIIIFPWLGHSAWHAYRELITT
jgi:uncharacterized membrane protein